MLSPQEIRELRRGTFRLDCPHMVLERPGANPPDEFSGPGSVVQTGTELSFTLYVTHQARNYDDVLRDTFRFEPVGTGVKESRYYVLRVRDLHGREWTASDILPSHDFGAGMVLRGSLHELIHTDAVQANKHPEGNSVAQRVSFHIFHDLRFPVNRATLWYRQQDSEEQRLARIERNMTMFAVGGSQFVLTHEEDYVVLQARLSSDLAGPHAAPRVREALEFILGQSIEWTVSYEVRDSIGVTCVRPSPETGFSRSIAPPIRYEGTEIGGAQGMWDLLGRYLRRIMEYQDTTRSHPMSTWISMVRNVGDRSFYAEILALSVAIEGIVTSEFDKPDAEVPEQEVDRLLEHVRNWDGDEGLRERAGRLLSGLKHIPAVQRLRALAEDGAVEGAYVNAWQKLRNRTAHAELVKPEEIREIVSLSDRAYTLMYQLVFAAIGYRGPHTDYGSQGWPSREYPGERREL